MGRDRYTAALKCHKCGRDGVAHLSAADNATWLRNKSVSLDTLPEGFKQVRDTSREHGIGIRRIIFDVAQQPKLAATASGAQVMRRFAFNKQQSWVRHDEHYHVDFSVPCR